MVEGAITDGARRCAAGHTRSLLITEQPSLPTLMFPSGEWSYRLAIGSYEMDTTTRFSVQNLCDGEPVCQATVSLHISGEPAAVATSTTTSTTVAPTDDKGNGSLPRCYDDRQQLTTHTYRPGDTYMAHFPMTLTAPLSSCALTAVIEEQPAYGLMAVMGSLQHPLSYLYSAPPAAEGQQVMELSNVTYRVQCNQATFCEAVLQVRVESAPGDCVQQSLHFATVSTPLEGTLDLGSLCKAGEEEDRIKVVDLRTASGAVWDASLQLTGLAFEFEGFAEEDYVVVVDHQCRSIATRQVERVCRSSIVFIVSAESNSTTTSTTEAPHEQGSSTTTTTSTAAPVESLLGSFFYNVAIGSSLFSTILLDEEVITAKSACSSAIATGGLRYAVVPSSEEAWTPTPPGALPSHTSTNSSAFQFIVNLLGQFEFSAAPAASEFVETEKVAVWCGEAYLGLVRMDFTVFQPINGDDSNSTEAPTRQPHHPDDVPSMECPNVYYYSTPTGVALHSTLLGVPGEELCAASSTPYFQLLTPLPSLGTMALQPSGDFLYTPPPAPQEAAVEFTFRQFCSERVRCIGRGYVIASDAFDDYPHPTPSPDPDEDDSTPPARLTCAGTCVDQAWKTFPTHHVWGSSASVLSTAAESVDVQWKDESLVITADTLIGVMGVRFPSFAAVDFTSTSAAADLSSSVPQQQLVAFNTTCLASQSTAGKGEDEWVWTSLHPNAPATSQGKLGSLYRSGSSWYHVFGGKHVECDVFRTQRSVCSFAPLLTAQPPWRVDIQDCRARWTGTFPYDALLQLRSGSSSAAAVAPAGASTTSTMQELEEQQQQKPVFTFTARHLLSGSVVTQAVQPHLWSSSSGGVDSDVRSFDVQIELTPHVEVLPTAFESRPFSVDVRSFSFDFSDADKLAAPAGNVGDVAFGINLLLYPRQAEAVVNQHVVGYKWLQQVWSSAGSAACPTCEGSKLRCYVGSNFSVSTYEDDAFPFGECPPGVGRVQLWKGPATSLQAYEQSCPGMTPPVGFIAARRGFSSVSNCHTPTAQNLTIRGVLPGSGALSEEQRRQLQLEGTVLLQMLMADGLRHNLMLKISYYVSYISKQLLLPSSSSTGSGEVVPQSAMMKPIGSLRSCLASPYSPVLDPLGYSTPYRPLWLVNRPPGQLCTDPQATTYGPTDWALFVLDLTDAASSAAYLVVGNVYVLYRHTDSSSSTSADHRIYLRYIDPQTGMPGTPPLSEGQWWQSSAPYLSYRDLSAHTVNKTLAGTMSPGLGEQMGVDRSTFSFMVVPGSVGWRSEAEVVVEAVYYRSPSSSLPTSVEFRHVIHVTPSLTEVVRYGSPSNAAASTDVSSTTESERRRLLAEVVVVVVAGLLLLSVIILIAMDKKKPLPHWMPRGEVLGLLWRRVVPTKSSVSRPVAPAASGLSSPPAVKRPKMKEARDMYDAMSSGLYE